MNADDFGKWFAAHCGRFPQIEESDAADFRRMLSDVGATYEDAEEASYRLSNEGCRFKDSTRPKLRSMVLAVRAERAPKTEVQECRVCFGAGMVSVPHPARIKDGIWDGKTTMAVGCKCGNPRPPGIQSLGEYEANYSNWPLLMNRTADEKIEAVGLDAAKIQDHLGWLAGRVERKEITLTQAKALYAEPFIEAAEERNREAKAAAYEEQSKAYAEVRRLEKELAAKVQTGTQEPQAVAQTN